MKMNNGNNHIYAIMLFVFILLSAIFSITEIVFSSANKFKIKANYEKNPKKNKLTFDLSNNFDVTISTILVGNNLVNIATTATATLLFTNCYGEESGPLISTIVTTLLVLIFGEILPKLIGSISANSLVYILSYPLKFFEIIFKPITYVVNKFVNLLSGLWKKQELEPSLTDEELIDIVEDMEENKTIDEDESNLIKNAIEFSDTDVYSILTPRVDLIGFDINDDVSEFKTNPDLLSHSSILIYNENFDDILGYVDIKDILKNLIKNNKFDIKDYIKEVLYVNETKKISDLLIQMKEDNYEVAVIVDEYGGTDGIITIEDILEELVGDIWDEKDKVSYPFKKINNSTYLVDGDMNIFDFFDEIEFDRSDFESEYSTVSGFISELLDKIPEVNDSVSYKNLSFKVLAGDETSATKIKVSIK